jgi:transposase
MDRGMSSPETLKLLGQDRRRYILGTPKSLLKKFEAELAKTDWEKVRDGREVKRCPSPFGNEQEIFVLCRSMDRQAKEKAIRERFVKRIETALGSLQKNCASGRLANVKQTERHIGRLLERHRRAAKFFALEVKEQNRAVQRNWSKLEKQLSWANLSEGCYALRSNVKEWTSEELWKAYIQLTDAEEAFRIHKDDLKLRPVWHQKENRVKAHILICFLAYVLWKCFGQMCKQAGLGDEPRKVIQEIKKLQLTDVILPTRKGVDIRLRCVSTPEPDLAMLLQKLKLKPPARLTPNVNL